MPRPLGNLPNTPPHSRGRSKTPSTPLVLLLLCVLSGFASLTAPAAPLRPIPPPTFPDTAIRALNRFQSDPDLTLELIAAEPLVSAPCALAWDESGALYVAENRGYPTGTPDGQPLGRIARLTDTTGDGDWNHRSDFATNLSFPNGILPWRGGLLVTCAPDLLWFKDADGDGHAEIREVILTGFATNQSTQLRVNRPLLGPDGWVYLASGLSGGRITSPRRPQDPPLDLRGDVRVNPDTGEYQPVDGPSQFGQDIDDFGRRFGCHNRVQVRHFVFPSSAAARHPFLAPPGVFHDCPERIENPWLPAGGGAASLFPISANQTTADSHAGTFTAACGILLWPGGNLPPRFNGGVFSCDPTANLVHFDQLIPAGPTFSARRLPGTNEFLRSPDNAFRPVYLAQGPDGALYIADMYRPSIEHPDYLPEEVRRRTDFTSGRDLGRIWRLRTAPPARERRVRTRPVPVTFSNQPIPLINDLSSTNRWRRDTAFRLLLHSGPHTNLPTLLHTALEGSRTVTTAARILQLLDRIEILDPDTVLTCLAAPQSELRELGLRFAPPHLTSHAGVATAVATAARDDDPRVRFLAALALAGLSSEAPALAIPALASIALSDGHDRWTRAAVLSSIPQQERAFLFALLSQSPVVNDPAIPVLDDLGALLGRMIPPESQGELIETLFAIPGIDLARSLVLLGAFVDAAPALPESLTLLSARCGAGSKWRVLQEAASVAIERGESLPVLRLAGVRLASQLDPVPTRQALADLLQSDAPAQLLAVAARHASVPPHADLAPSMLSPDQWELLPPPNQAALLQALINRPSQIPQVIAALASGTIARHQLSVAQRESLLRVADPKLLALAKPLLLPNAPADRQAALRAASPSLDLPGDSTAGRLIFRNLCAACHRLEGEGINVGPDLYSVRNQSRESLLLHLLVPSQEISPQFLQYRCETRDGSVHSGLLISESPGAITLRMPQGLEQTLARTDISRLETVRESLMPDGLEKAMSHQDLADLLAFLKGSPPPISNP